MKFLLTILSLFLITSSFSQKKENLDSIKLVKTIQEFHQALVQKNTISLNQQTDKALSYGHSNGWVETKNDLIKDLETKVISYESYKEDSITIIFNDKMANVRFAAEITATMKNTQFTYHLKVLEVWVRKGNRWVLFARQAIK
jgi:biopolymer transport protein ExbD